MIRYDENGSVYVGDIEPNVEYSIRIQDLLSRIEKLEAPIVVVDNWENKPIRPERTGDATTHIFLDSNMEPKEKRLIKYRWDKIKKNYPMKLKVIETENWLERLNINKVDVYDGVIEFEVENKSNTIIYHSRTSLRLIIDNSMFETNLNLFSPCGC